MGLASARLTAGIYSSVSRLGLPRSISNHTRRHPLDPRDEGPARGHDMNVVIARIAQPFLQDCRARATFIDDGDSQPLRAHLRICSMNDAGSRARQIHIQRQGVPCTSQRGTSVRGGGDAGHHILEEM
jgi:hypothetical protein